MPTFGNWTTRPPRPRRTYRALRPTRPFAAAIFDGSTYRDSAIRQITITRGTGDAAPGTTPHTAEIELVGAVHAAYGRTLHVDLDLSATVLAPIASDSIRPRFRGFVELQDQEITQIDASERLIATSRVIGTGPLKLFAQMIAPIDVPFKREFGAVKSQIKNDRSFGEIWNTPTMDKNLWVLDPEGDPLTVKAYLSTINELGVYTTTRRSGEVVFTSVEVKMTERASIDLTLQTDHVLSPIKRSQTTELVPTIITPRVRVWDGAGFNETLMRPTKEQLSALGLSRAYYDTKDWTKLLTFGNSTPGGQLDRTLTSSWARIANRRYGVPELSIDMLGIARRISHASGVARDRLLAVAQAVLALEQGDPMRLGTSFGPVAGRYFAMGIKEQLGPDSWEITISLASEEEVIGFSPGRETWALSIKKWIQAHRTWEETSDTL